MSRFEMFMIALAIVVGVFFVFMLVLSVIQIIKDRKKHGRSFRR